MSKNDVIIITTRWMDAWVSDEGVQKTPVHRSEKARFVEKELSSAKSLTEYLNSHSGWFVESYSHDRYYCLNDGRYFVCIIPCFPRDTPCSDPKGWIRALVYQFSQAGDNVYMMLHASTDLQTDTGLYPSPKEFSDRNLKIRAFSHVGDPASQVLLEDTYIKSDVAISAEQIARYVSRLFVDLRSCASAFKSKWDDFRYGEATFEEVCEAYKQLLINCPKEIDSRGDFLIDAKEFITKAQVRDNRTGLTRWINQLIGKF